MPSTLYAVMHPADNTLSDRQRQPMEIVPVNGYAVIERIWKPGDTVRLVSDARTTRGMRRPRCEQCRQVALQRGPLVYCIEGVDVEGGRVLNLMLPDAAALTTEYKPDLLGGVTVIKGTAQELRRDGGGAVARTDRAFSAIPYYAWAHRGRTPMAVWLPRTEQAAALLPADTIASQSKVSTSFLTTVGDTRLEYVNDQLIPNSSGDHEQGFFHWWPRMGTTEWIQYEFVGTKTVSAVSVYWFDDTGRGECRIPRSWKVLYRDGSAWKPVNNLIPYPVTRDAFDRVGFEPVTTDALRLEVTFRKNVSAGIQEWVVE